MNDTVMAFTRLEIELKRQIDATKKNIFLEPMLIAVRNTLRQLRIDQIS